ncbi:MAG: hypothetical protein ABI129_01540 [Rhodanobacter sp.]
MPSKPLSMAEFKAMGELARARQQLVVNMFSGTELKFGTSSRLSVAKDVLSSGKKILSSAKKAAKGGKAVSTVADVPGMKEAVHNFIVECADVDNIHEVIAAITGEVLANLVHEITPVLGVVTSSVKLAKAGKAVAEDGYHLYKSDDYRQGFRLGDPSAAAQAIQVIIKRDLAKHSVQLGQHALATGAKIGGLFADFGTATTAGIGIANSLASLGLTLYGLGLDIKDMRAGNKRLVASNTLDLNVFKECPILGCYLLTCADTSAVANMFIADIGLPGWMDKVELMKKQQMEPMLAIANKNIRSSRLQLEGLSSNKGTHAKQSFFSGIKSSMLKRIGLS